jgi:hypothetical protein
MSSLTAPGLEPFVLEAHVVGRYAAGTTRGAIVFCWLDDATVETVQFLEQLCEKQSAARTRCISALHVIHAGVGLPSSDVRTALVASMKRYASVLGSMGVVLLGAGFWASAMQSALLGVRMLAPVGVSQLRVGASLEEIVPWLVAGHEQRTQEKLSESSLLAAAERLTNLDP